jgi:lysine-N-methylase
MIDQLEASPRRDWSTMGGAARENLEQGERERSPDMDAEVDTERDFTLRYMTRFGCIGPDCEDNCCRDGWRVDVDLRSYRRLELATRNRSEWRRRIKQAVRPYRGQATKKQVRGPRRRPPPERYVLRMQADNSCPLLEENGFCALHAEFGETVLPTVCASYPRWLHGIGDQTVLTGLLSCPEVARELLLPADAVEREPLDKSQLPRQLLNRALAARDVRPYYALQHEVRDFMWELLDRTDYSIEHRLFFMTYFANRTASVLDRGLAKGDVDFVRREMHLLDSPKVLPAIAERFEQMETPSALVVRLARELVRKGVLERERQNFRELVDGVFDSYVRLRELVAAEEGDEEQASTPQHREREVNSREVMIEYRRRQARVLRLGPERVAQYLHHFAYHYWLNRLPIESPNVLVHVLRMLTEMAVQKFLFFSHPGLHRELDGLEGDPTGGDGRSPEGGPGVAAADPVQDVLDRYAVDVFYKVARYIEHSALIENLESALRKMGLESAAGAVYLIRF